MNSTNTDVRFGRLAQAVFGFLMLCALVTVFGSKDVADAVGALGVAVGATLAGGLFIVRARTVSGRERIAWTLIGLGLCVAAVGVLVVAVVFFTLGDAPTFGWTDLFFLATYVLVIAGALTLPYAQGSTMQRFRMILDGLIGGVSIAALLWVLLLADMTSDLADSSTLTRTIGALYPFLDLVVLTVAMSVLLRRSRHRFDMRVLLFSGGVLFQVVGDIAIFSSGQSGSFADTSPLYWVNLLAMGLFFASASLVGQPSVGREYADRNPPLWTQIAPYVPALGMLGVFITEAAISGDMAVDPTLLGAVIVVGLLVIARQAVAIVDNRATIEQQRDLLVTTISHELRTPLTAIVGYVDLLAEGGDRLDNDQRSMLAIIHQQADYMSTIVSDLIMLARGSDRGLELEVEPVLVDDLAVASIHASGIGVETVRLDGETDLVAFVDRARMQQVLVNLLTNAARYGGPQRLLRVVSDGADVTFEVHDDGPGLPRRYEVRVWDRFERGPNRLNAAVPGSGIGLAVVSAIAQAHGGTSAYRTSEILGGACFSVTLPGRATHDPTERRGTQATSEIRSVA
ncbi:MAG: HAMP domain-containing histidine kinase [Acidimicrobiia bacterium]|nr:HAMP domain-containing histidine kinase [Acidimicrobiia bacterium]